MPDKFFIETYGCQMNTAESSALRADLESKGWVESADPDSAELIIINTCSVRKTAENRIWGRLGYYKRLKQNNNFRLVVIGCMAERLKDDIKKKFPVVDEVVSNFKKVKIPGLAGVDMNEISASTDGIDETYTFFENHGSVSKTHSMIPIMNGCDNYCSYCIVPYVRGREISRSRDQIVDEITALNLSGVSEITLLGQNVNSYSYGEHDFSDLLNAIVKETDTKWLRFTSSNPQDFTDKLIETVAENEKICSFIHLPAQHGSDRILDRMNRKYTAEEYIKLALRLKSLPRKISLSTDLMVGFPGESEDDFLLLKDMMNTVRFEEAFTYYYNPREGTKAYGFTDDVEHETKLRRLSEIIELQQKITSEEKAARLGTVTEAVVENVSKKNSNEILARTEKNSMVVFPGKYDNLSGYVKLKLVGLKGNTFTGEVADV